MRQLKNDLLRQFINKGVILISLCGIVSCTPEITAYFWNGHYSSKKRAEEYDREAKAYYDKENYEQRELRKKNQTTCREIAKKKYPNETIWEGDNGLKRDFLYKNCMRENGSPVYSGN